MLFAECNDQGRVRGLARWNDPLPAPLALDALPDAIMAITIGNVERGQRYQGLVDLQHAGLAASLENYFVQSEQLPARILLAADGEQAVGPDAAEDAGRRWPCRCAGRGCVEPHHSSDCDAGRRRASRHSAPEQLLYRLYHEESVRLFEPRPLAFGCSCSRERVTTMLRSLGRAEVEAALAARDGEIEVICEFCAQHYHFDRIDAEHLLSDSATVDTPDTEQ